MKKPNVFISSTFSDLKSHRKQLWNTLEKFEVNILGMEKFGARKEDSLTTCLKEVESCEIFILIVGMRFGTTDKKSQKSYTWLEYERAYELDKDILVYLIDENVGEIKVSDFDKENYQKLTDFKEILKENHTIDSYVNVNDLVKKIFEILETKTKDYLTKSVRPEIIESKKYQFDGQKNRFIIFVGYIDEKPFEIHTCHTDDEDGVLIPRSVNRGFLIESSYNDSSRIDFQYMNKRGYKTTIEGIDYYSESSEKFSNFDKTISSLLKDNVEIFAIKNLVNQFDNSDQDFVEWKNIILEILEN
jgi:hypothetical protein